MEFSMEDWRFPMWLQKNKKQLKVLFLSCFAVFVFGYTLVNLQMAAQQFDVVQALGIAVTVTGTTTAAFKLLLDSLDYGLTKNPK